VKNYSLVLPLLLLATTLVYINGLGNPLVPDDRGIIFKNFRSSEGWMSTNFFGRSLFAREPSESTYFRPLTLLTFGLNYELAKEKPEGYRMVNIAIHLLVVSLTFLLLSRLATRWVATFSTLLFALHPVHVQAVSYISSRSDPLYTALALFSLLLWHEGNQAQGNRRQLYLGLALSSYFLGLFAKETMIVVPGLALVMDLAWNNAGSWQKKIKQNLIWYLGFLLLFSIYFSIRLEEGFPLTMEGSRKLATGIEVGLGARLLLAVKLFGLYISLAFYPVHLYFFRIVPLPQTFFEWGVISGLILLAVLVFLIRRFWRSQREISFGILWFLVSIFPVLNLIRLNADMMEHWLYLPLVGLTLAFVCGVRSLAERVGGIRGAAIGLILLALLLSARTVTRNAEWSDLVKVFSQNVSAYPTHPTAGIWLADALKEQGKWNDAIRAYKAVLALNPHYSALVGLADVLSAVGRDDEAGEILSRAASANPQDPWLFHILAIHRLKVGNNRGALEAIENNIALNPSADAYHVLGSAFLRVGEKGKAEQAFYKAVLMEASNPRVHAAAHVRLGKLYITQEKLKEAREEWQLALRFDPNNAEARSLLQDQAGK